MSSECKNVVTASDASAVGGGDGLLSDVADPCEGTSLTDGESAGARPVVRSGISTNTIFRALVLDSRFDGGGDRRWSWRSIVGASRAAPQSFSSSLETVIIECAREYSCGVPGDFTGHFESGEVLEGVSSTIAEGHQ
jgi:hypothetical protein